MWASMAIIFQIINYEIPFTKKRGQVGEGNH